MTINKKRAEQFFEKIKQSVIDRYNEYWETLKPQTTDDFLRRYLFAFTSVHTGWKGNINGYKAIRNLGWLENKEDLRERLLKSRCGMHNTRTNYIWEFAQKFYADPKKFTKIGKNWIKKRNILVKEINGIGMAKVSFAMEMCFPLEVQVTCIDTHGIQLYEIPFVSWNTKKQIDCYQKAERHWIKCSALLGASPYITRSIYWDQKQKRRNTRYWSHVLE